MENSNNGRAVDELGRIVYKIEFSHLVLINLVIILPAMIHFMETWRKTKNGQCNSFIESIIFGCLLSCLVWILGISFLLFSESVDSHSHMCSTYKIFPNIILIWLVKCTVMHHVLSRVRHPLGKTCFKWVGVVWAVCAVVVNVMVSNMDNRKCVPSVLLYSTASSTTMNGLSVLRVLYSVMFVPPAILIVVAYACMDKTNRYDEKCPVCARTMNVFDQFWWKLLLCFTVSVFRTYVLLSNWIEHNMFRDFPPMIMIVTLFYPVVFAQSVNHLKLQDIVRRLRTNQVKHV